MSKAEKMLIAFLKTLVKEEKPLANYPTSVIKSAAHKGFILSRIDHTSTGVVLITAAGEKYLEENSHA